MVLINLKIAIIGGGISGLACAHRLCELRDAAHSNLEIFLFEAGLRLGGTIQTQVHDGFVVERGADAFLSEKPEALELAKHLGIENEIIGTCPDNRRSFILQSGRLVPVPPGFYLIAPSDLVAFLKTPLFSLSGKFRMMMEPFIPMKNIEDETVADFVRRRLGKECLERVAQPMLAGIYTGDPEKLGMASTVPRFLEFERKYGSVLRGLFAEKQKREKKIEVSGPRYSLFLSFKKGMATLVDSLAQNLSGVTIRLNSQVKEIVRESASKKWRVVFSSGEGRTMDAVVLALPAHAISRILEKTEPFLASALGAVPYESVATVNLAYKKQEVGHALDGFGFVVPKAEANAILAASFSSRKFEGRAPVGCVLIRAFVGGAFGKRFWEMEDFELLREVRREIEQVLRITGAPVFSLLSRYPRAMIQYPPGYPRKIEQMKQMFRQTQGLYGAGPVFASAGTPDCIRQGQETAGEIFKDFSERKPS